MSKFPHQKVEEAVRLIRAAKHIVILTHLSPDGDAMGSSLGMRHWLQSFSDASVDVIVPNSFPSFLAWMPGAKEDLVYDEKRAESDVLLEQADLVICTDFNEPKRIGLLGEKLLSLSCPSILIDHHLHPSDFATVIFSCPESPSASELTYRFAVESGLGALNLDAATCFYTGMMTDTGNFSFNSNYPEMYEVVAELLRLGVNKDAVYNAVFNQYSADRMRLVGYCLNQKMRIYPEYHTAFIGLSKRELMRFNFHSGDAEGIVNMPLQIADIYYVCFMREDKVSEADLARAGGKKIKVKISLRSQGNRPVNIFAHDCFAGGGHANASGGEFYGSVAEAFAHFEQHFRDYFLTE